MPIDAMTGAPKVEDAPQTGSAVWIERAQSPWAVGTLLLTVIVINRLGTWDALPTWDSAMTVWPAAVEMAESRSISEVLGLPTYWEGGPNTHTLSLVTLAAAAAVFAFGVPVAYVVFHVLNVIALAAIGVLVYSAASRFSDPWVSVGVALGTVAFPVMVGQSAYLYTEIGSAAFALLALVLASRSRVGLSAVALGIAILIKPLAVVALPAVLFMVFRDRGLGRWVVLALLPAAAVMPALLVPSAPPQATGRWEQILLSWDRSSFWILQAPELLLVASLPIGAVLLVLRRDPGEKASTWAFASFILFFTLTGFFVFNPLFTPGYFLIPRYFVLIMGPSFVALAVLLKPLRRWITYGVLAGLLVFGLLGSKGPLALGASSPRQPMAERSLAYLGLFGEHRIGLQRLADLSERMPVFYGHLAHYGYSYPEMLHYEGDAITNGTAVSLESGWGNPLSSLPDEFAMLVDFPYLGGGQMRRVQANAEADPQYLVRIETLGTASSFPVEIVVVQRITGVNR